jgi:hypothetical protein
MRIHIRGDERAPVVIMLPCCVFSMAWASREASRISLCCAPVGERMSPSQA